MPLITIDALISMFLMALLAYIIYTKMKNQTLGDTFEEVKGIFIKS